MKRLAAFSCAVLALGCSSSPEVEHVSAAERGQLVFEAAAKQTDVSFACADCHSTDGADDSRILPGADLRGVTGRSSFWGGQENDLLRAVNDCRTHFQQAEALRAEDASAQDLYAFLSSLEGSRKAVPFTIVRSVQDLSAGDAKRGLGVYQAACQTCHGELHSGAGSRATAPILPDDVLLEHSQYPADEQRVVFIEKVRHGGFLGYSGAMPPFSLEALSDEQLADVLSALELYGP